MLSAGAAHDLLEQSHGHRIQTGKFFCDRGDGGVGRARRQLILYSSRNGQGGRGGISVKYFGKYRGLVTDNRDPEQMGRIRAKVPDVLGEAETSWAMPCVTLPLSDDVGSALPAIGANVWIEFEQGEPDYPIWSGSYFTGAAETPRSLWNTP